MSRDEIEGVSAHEVTHIANGDMLTMTLLQGLANAFVYFFSRLVARLVAERIENSGMRMLAYFAVSLVAQIVFMLLAAIPLNWFSRKREFRADAGSARIAGRQKMISALKALDRFKNQDIADEDRVPEAVAALAINNGRNSMALLFASHPPIEARIRALETMTA